MRALNTAVTVRDSTGQLASRTVTVLERDKIEGGYYLGGLRDITANTYGRGMRVAAHTTYRSIAQGAAAFPGSTWLDPLARAHNLHVTFVLELKVYGAAPPTDVPQPDGVMSFHPPGTRFYSWKQVLSGKLDPLLLRCANAAKVLPYPITIQFASERDTDHQIGGTIADVAYSFVQLDALGVQGVTYMVNLFRSAGATNATYTAGTGGWHHDSFVRAYVAACDAIQYNAYNHGANRPAYDVFNRTYAWLGELPANGMKPVHITEWGCDANLNQGAWIRTVPAALAHLPRITVASYFDSGWGTLGTDGLPALVDAYAGPLFR